MKYESNKAFIDAVKFGKSESEVDFIAFDEVVPELLYEYPKKPMTAVEFKTESVDKGMAYFNMKQMMETSWLNYMPARKPKTTAYNLLATPDHWIKKTSNHMGSNGVMRMCLGWAILKKHGQGTYHGYNIGGVGPDLHRVATYIRAKYPRMVYRNGGDDMKTIVNWNDHPDVTFTMVKAVLKETRV